MFSGVLEWLFWKTRPSKIWGIATIMTITGCILLFINSGERAIHLGGVGLTRCRIIFCRVHKYE
ncbi:EamA family transporter OS=Lysinibacillus sphaericus OX=1421 GN=LS41612_20840 PE=3 SV=1 [Lysinibacillus sphaericus]